MQIKNEEKKGKRTETGKTDKERKAIAEN